MVSGKIVFRMGGEYIEFIIKENDLMIMNQGMVTTIEGLKLNRHGVLIEHPDLNDNEDWQKIARERFKEHFKQIKTYSEKVVYLIKELNKHGYSPMYSQRVGFRPEKIRL